MLLDPDDVAAGHEVQFRRATPDKIVRWREPAHPAIVARRPPVGAGPSSGGTMQAGCSEAEGGPAMAVGGES